jgi:SAM-dependent methyltransferase
MTGSPDGSYHAAHLLPDPARAVVWGVVASYLAPWIPQDAEILEIGAGYCDWINAVKGHRRVAVDLWPELPAHAAPGVETVVTDLAAHGLGHVSGQFDAVLASNLLEHFEPDRAASLVGEVHDRLRRGGRFLVVQPNFRYASRRYFDDYTHRAVFTHVSLAALLRSKGFEIERSEPRFLPYSMQGRRWPIASWLVRAYLQSPFRPRAGQMLVVGRKP